MKKPVLIFSWMLSIVFCSLIAGGAGELWIRLFIPVKNICYVSDPDTGVRFCPNQKRYGYVEKNYSNYLITNSYGFHDKERRLRKDSDIYRIQIYGDSMIQGYGVPLEKTIPILIEKYLNKELSPKRFEVLNMASGDDGTSSQVMTYLKVGRNFEPDLVICYFMNDFADNVIKIHSRLYSPYHEISSDGSLQLIPPIPKNTSTLWEKFKLNSLLYRHMANRFLESKLYDNISNISKNLIAYARSVINNNSESNARDFYEYRKQVCINEGWPLTLRILEYFNELVRMDNRLFLIAEGDTFLEATVGTKYSNKDFENYLDSEAIPYIPAYEEYSKIREMNDFNKYFFKDHHLKPIGNEKIAKFLAKRIMLFLHNNKDRLYASTDKVTKSE